MPIFHAYESEIFKGPVVDAAMREGIMVKGWRLLRKTNLAKFALLLSFPLFGRPLDFVNGPRRRSYAFARLGWALPFAAATVWSWAAAMMFSFVSQSHFEEYVEQFGAQQAHSRVLLMGKIVIWETIGLILMAVVSIAALRFGYFLLIRQVLMNFRVAPERVPFRYFLTSTSSTAFLYGCVGLLFSGSIRYVDFVEPALAWVGDVGVLLALGVVGFLSHRVLKNRRLGVRELYGSRIIPFVADMVALGLALAALFLLSLAIQA